MKCHKLWKKFIRGGGQSQNQNSLHFKCRLLWLEGGSEFFTFFPISIILQLFCNITFIRNVWKSKMSEFDPRGGVSNFQKCLKFKKVWNFRWGGGVKPIWEFFPNFSVFFFMMAPLIIFGSKLMRMVHNRPKIVENGLKSFKISKH